MGVPPEEWHDGAYIQDPDGIGPAISFLKVPEPKAVERLTAAGATVIREEMQDGTPTIS